MGSPNSFHILLLLRKELSACNRDIEAKVEKLLVFTKVDDSSIFYHSLGSNYRTGLGHSWTGHGTTALLIDWRCSASPHNPGSTAVPLGNEGHHRRAPEPMSKTNSSYFLHHWVPLGLETHARARFLGLFACGPSFTEYIEFLELKTIQEAGSRVSDS